MRASTIAFLFSLSCLLTARPARPNPIDAFGFGSRAAAMGGAATAASEDSSANYYNPAGLVRGTELRLDVGYRYAQPSLHIDGHDEVVDATRGFLIGLVAPGAIGPVRFAFGAAFAIPDQRLFRVRSLAFQAPRFVYYDNRTQRMFLSANLAFQIVRGLYIGAGITFMSRTQGQVNLSGNVAYTNPDDSGLVSKIDVGLFAVRYPEVGILWDALPWLSVGASYRHSFTLQLDQQFRIDGSVGNPGVAPLVPAGYFSTTALVDDLFQPWQLTAGLAARWRRLLFTFDATFARWSEFPANHALELALDIGVFNSRVHLAAPRTYPDPGFHDILIPRFGVEWRVWDRRSLALDLRGGYSWERSPVPEQSLESNLADCDKHTFSVGAGVELRMLESVLPGPLAVDAHLAATWLPRRSNQKIDPRDLVGDFTADGSVVQLGVTLRSRF
jgi:long-chain fatty acid transport protein